MQADLQTYPLQNEPFDLSITITLGPHNKYISNWGISDPEHNKTGEGRHHYGYNHLRRSLFI